MKDYYKILWVSIHANSWEIKSQFKNLVKKFHPDHNPAQNAGEYFRDIHEAYEVLSSDLKREEYDKAYEAFKAEERSKRKESIKLWLKRVLTILFSLFIWAWIYFLLWKSWLTERILLSFSWFFLSYFSILLIFFNFSWFFNLQKQAKIWRIHSIMWISSFLIIFFKLFYLLPFQVNSKYSILLFFSIALFFTILLKVLFFTQEVFLQIKKWNFVFFKMHFLEVFFTAVFASVVSILFCFMLYSSIWAPIDFLSIFSIWILWWFIATLFSSFSEE